MGCVGVGGGGVMGWCGGLVAREVFFGCDEHMAWFAFIRRLPGTGQRSLPSSPTIFKELFCISAKTFQESEVFFMNIYDVVGRISGG